MNDVDVLRDLFREDTLATIAQSSSRQATVVLEESEDPPYELSITGAPYDTIAFKTDRFPRRQAFSITVKGNARELTM
jgi:hypothetical protein